MIIDSRHGLDRPVRSKAGEYVCPMHAEVRQAAPGNCPKCGMALEPVASVRPPQTEYTCPMHPEIIRSEPGNCPICGMALEPRTAFVEEENRELADMTRRFWVSVVLTIAVLIPAMSEYLPSRPLEHFAHARTWTWFELILATPIVLWGGWPFFVRFWQPLVNRSLNMSPKNRLSVMMCSPDSPPEQSPKTLAQHPSISE